MAWQATLTAVGFDLDKTVDGFKITCTLSDGTNTTTRTYTIWLNELPDLTAASLKAKIQADIDQLTKLDTVKAYLTPKIGTVL